jgi:NTE family protein
VKGDVSGLTANVALDTQDYAFFPTKGFKANATYFLADRVSGGFETYGRAEGRLSGAWSFGDLILLGGIAGGQATKGKLPIGDGFSLGGLGKLSAYAPNQILGQEAYGLGNVQVQYHLTQPMPILGFSLLAGVAYEAGYMKNPVTEPTLTGRIDSWGVYLAANSFLGPIYLGYSRSPQGTGRVYLFVGTP